MNLHQVCKCVVSPKVVAIVRGELLTTELLSVHNIELSCAAESYLRQQFRGTASMLCYGAQAVNSNDLLCSTLVQYSSTQVLPGICHPQLIFGIVFDVSCDNGFNIILHRTLKLDTVLEVLERG